MNGIKKLINAQLEDLLLSFVKTVTSTRHKMNIALPHFNTSVDEMKTMSAELKHEHEKPLRDDKTIDIQVALASMASVVKKILVYVTESTEESESLQERIEKLKATIRETVVEYMKIAPVISGLLGSAVGVGGCGAGAIAAVESAGLGGAGALVLGGISFPPIGALIAASVVGGIAFGTVFGKLRQRQQLKSLEYLKLKLEDLDKLSEANLSFIKNTRNSKENMNALTYILETLKTSLENPTPTQRLKYAEKCEEAVQSTVNIIDCIHQLNRIDFKGLVVS